MSEQKLLNVMESKAQMLHTKDYENKDVIVNKAHIVQAQVDDSLSAKASKLPDPETQKRIEATKKRYGKED